jgi:hypothetical protein
VEYVVIAMVGKVRLGNLMHNHNLFMQSCLEYLTAGPDFSLCQVV